MTLLEIEILMHYAVSAADWRNGDHSAPILPETFNRLMEEGLLVHSNFHVEHLPDGKLKARYAVTDRAKKFIGVLQEVPLPVQRWIMPMPWPQCDPEFREVGD